MFLAVSSEDQVQHYDQLILTSAPGTQKLDAQIIVKIISKVATMPNTQYLIYSRPTRRKIIFCIKLAMLIQYVLLPRDARSAKRGIAIVSPSVRPSVCNVDVPWAYRLDQFEVITRIISLGSSLLGATTSAIYSPKGTPLKFGWNRGGVVLLRKLAISLKWGKIGPRLLLMTYRKHTHF